LYSFHLFIKMDASGGLSQYQKEQLGIFASRLAKSKVELIWIPEGGARAGHVRSVMRQLRESFRNRGMLIHNVLISKDKEPGFFTAKAARLMNMELSKGLCARKSDIKRIKGGLVPEGRAFSSCLGHTAYLLPEGLCLCPEAVDVRLNDLSREQPLRSIFDTESFRRLLISHIEKRRVCAESCAYNHSCRGGCPLRCADERCVYKAGVDRIELTDDERFLQSARRLSDIYRG